MNSKMFKASDFVSFKASDFLSFKIMLAEEAKASLYGADTLRSCESLHDQKESLLKEVSETKNKAVLNLMRLTNMKALLKTMVIISLTQYLIPLLISLVQLSQHISVLQL